MINHYKILGVPEYATLQEIKSAYKQLAKKFHPDINPDPLNQEKFKLITAAFNILKDPVKRKKHDLILANSRRPVTPPPTYTQTSYTYQSNTKPYSRYKRPVKQVDAKTERIATLYAVGIIAVIALIVIFITRLTNYYHEAEQEKLITAFDLKLKEAERNHHLRNHQLSMLQIDSLRQFVLKNKSVYSHAINSVQEEQIKAQSAFYNQNYEQAIWGMLLGMQFRNEQSQSKLFNLAIAYKETHELDKAEFIFLKLLEADFSKILILRNLAELSITKNNDTSKAINYYESAMQLIEEDFLSTYGKAYRLLINSERTPIIYKDIYFDLAQLYYSSKHFEQARKLLEWTIFFYPTNETAYSLLADAYVRLGDTKRACKLIEKAKAKQIKISHYACD